MVASILIIENHNVLRKALRKWLKTKFPRCSVGEAVSVHDAIHIVQTCAPRVILMSLGIQQDDNLETIRQLKACTPLTHVVVLTTYGYELCSTPAMAAGASVCISMHSMPPTDLHSVLQHLLSSANRSAQIQERVLVGSN